MIIIILMLIRSDLVINVFIYHYLLEFVSSSFAVRQIRRLSDQHQIQELIYS